MIKPSIFLDSKKQNISTELLSPFQDNAHFSLPTYLQNIEQWYEVFVYICTFLNNTSVQMLFLKIKNSSTKVKSTSTSN